MREVDLERINWPYKNYSEERKYIKSSLIYSLILNFFRFNPIDTKKVFFVYDFEKYGHKVEVDKIHSVRSNLGINFRYIFSSQLEEYLCNTTFVGPVICHIDGIHHQNIKFFFENENDALMFKMTWR